MAHEERVERLLRPRLRLLRRLAHELRAAEERRELGLGHRRRLGHVEAIDAAVDLDFRRMNSWGAAAPTSEKPADVRADAAGLQWRRASAPRPSALAGASAFSRSARSRARTRSPPKARTTRACFPMRSAARVTLPRPRAAHVCFACSMTATWATVRSSVDLEEVLRLALRVLLQLLVALTKARSILSRSMTLSSNPNFR